MGPTNGPAVQARQSMRKWPKRTQFQALATVKAMSSGWSNDRSGGSAPALDVKMAKTNPISGLGDCEGNDEWWIQPSVELIGSSRLRLRRHMNGETLFSELTENKAVLRSFLSQQDVIDE